MGIYIYSYSILIDLSQSGNQQYNGGVACVVCHNAMFHIAVLCTSVPCIANFIVLLMSVSSQPAGLH